MNDKKDNLRNRDYQRNAIPLQNWLQGKNSSDINTNRNVRQTRQIQVGNTHWRTLRPYQPIPIVPSAQVKTQKFDWQTSGTTPTWEDKTPSPDFTPIAQRSPFGYQWKQTLWPELSGATGFLGEADITGLTTVTSTSSGDMSYSVTINLLDQSGTILKWATGSGTRNDYQQTVDHTIAIPEHIDGSANGTFDAVEWTFDTLPIIKEFYQIEAIWSVSHTESGTLHTLGTGYVYALLSWIMPE